MPQRNSRGRFVKGCQPLGNTKRRFNVAVLFERYSQPGMGSRKLGKQYGVSKTTIIARLKEAGYPVRASRGFSGLEGRWSIKGWKACRDCGTTKRPHKAKGLCFRCHSVKSQRASRQRRKLRARET